MNKFLYAAIPALLLLASCSIMQQGRIVLNPAEMTAFNSASYVITEHRNTAGGAEMPDWVIAYIDGGLAGVEALPAYQGHYAFIAKTEGNNFTALNHWMEGFSPELDFPRLAAARVEARFFSAAPLPDQEYGPYYEALVPTAFDFPWAGAIMRNDFWIRKSYFPAAGEAAKETWEFMILLTIDKMSFSAQLQSVFGRVKPTPSPSRDQMSAVNRVKDRFFEGF